jgi:hypothetical protein
MIIIRLKGGLGNQMFQYALYRELQFRGREVKMDEVNGFRSDLQRSPSLSVFGISYAKAADAEVREMTDSFMDPFSRVRRKLCGRKNREYNEDVRSGCFDPQVFELTDACLIGYWQTEKYFPDRPVQEALAADFLSREENILEGQRSGEDTAAAMRERILHSESVSLHIRRGDYLQPGVAENFGGICTEDYYRKAMERIRTAYPKAVFYVFSNDPLWVRENFSGPGIVPADGGSASIRSDAAQLLLMSRCRHHILANSSFSWWAAWLGQRRPAEGTRTDGLTIAPQRWLNHKNMEDIYTDQMIRI